MDHHPLGRRESMANVFPGAMPIYVARLNLTARRASTANRRGSEAWLERAGSQSANRRNIKRASARGLHLTVNTLTGAARMRACRKDQDRKAYSEAGEMFEHRLFP
jgi:hypothetical protein